MSDPKIKEYFNNGGRNSGNNSNNNSSRFRYQSPLESSKALNTNKEKMSVAH